MQCGGQCPPAFGGPGLELIDEQHEMAVGVTGAGAAMAELGVNTDRPLASAEMQRGATDTGADGHFPARDRRAAAAAQMLVDVVESFIDRVDEAAIGAGCPADRRPAELGFDVVTDLVQK